MSTEAIHNLLRAAVAQPNEHTIALILADALDENHPANNDGRATIIRKAVRSGTAQVGVDPEENTPHHVEQLPVGAIHTSVEKGTLGTPVFLVDLHDGKAKFSEPYWREFRYATTGSNEAREIADTLPNAGEIHRWLDKHYEPDPRPQQFARALNAVPKV